MAATSTSTFLIHGSHSLAQREKDDARRGYIQTLQQFWTAYFNLRRLTLYDFIRQTPLRAPLN